MNDLVYVVTGQAGFYEEMWLVRVFETEKVAEEFAAKLLEASHEIFEVAQAQRGGSKFDISNLDWDESIDERGDLRRHLEGLQELDPRGWIDEGYGIGALREDLEYHVTAVPFR